MIIKVLRTIEVDGVVDWECGDGCCSGSDYAPVDMYEGQLIDLQEHPHGYHKDQWCIDDPMAHDAERVFKCRIEELIEDGLIEEVKNE